MNLFLLFSLLLMSCLTYPKTRIIIDQVALTIHGPAHTTHICASDLLRPNLEGEIISTQRAIDQELVCQDMERFKITNGDEGKKHIERMKKENNYTDDDIKKMFEQTGRSTQDGIDEITRLQQYHGMEQMQTYANIFVSNQEIEEYYTNNPLYTEAEYSLRVAIIPYQEDLTKQAEYIAHQLKEDMSQLPWSSTLIIKEHELSEERRIIVQSLQDKCCAGPFVQSQGYELIQLLHTCPAGLISLKQRYKTIKTLLEKQKSDNFLTNYHAHLRNDAIVAYKQPLPNRNTTQS